MSQAKSANSLFATYFICPIVYILLFLCIRFDGYSQSSDSLKSELIMDMEIRPRAEYKDNYRLPRHPDFDSEFFISQRHRLSINYRCKHILFQASPQEIHLFNKGDRFSSIGNIGFFELYLEPRLTENLSLRIGRQRLVLDNGRIFSDAQWAQQSRSHEGLRAFFTHRKFNTDLMLATTRRYSEKWDVTLSPVASHLYKLLIVHHLHYKVNEHYTVTAINYGDVFDNQEAEQKHHYSITNGGRIAYENSNFYLTLNAYYQWGENVASKNIHAYYLQPEIRTVFNKTTLRVGAEVLSGQNTAVPNDQFNTFGINYGVAWRFMGNMNFFTRLPRDVNGSGLVNPYLFVIQKVNKKLSVRADGNLFYTQHPLEHYKYGSADRYLGFENDLSFEYKATTNVNIRYGFSYLLASENMPLLGKIEDNNKIPVWSFLMVSYHPRILHLKKLI